MKESQHVEWKESWRDDHLRLVCGFANGVTPHETPHEIPHVAVLVRLIGTAGEVASPELLRHLGLKDRKHLRERYLGPCLEEGWIEMTIPDRPRSRDQRYRLTVRGRELLARISEDSGMKS